MSKRLDTYLEELINSPGSGGMWRQSAVIINSLLEFQSSKSICGDMAEIGVYRGYGASLFSAFLLPNEKIFLIDPYTEENLFIDPIKRCAGDGIINQLVHVKVDSMKLCRDFNLFKQYDLRFFHIDGEHSYDAVMSDLELANRSLSSNGIVVIDDFFATACPSVTEAVFDFIHKSSADLSIFLIGFNKAYLCRNRSLGLYRSLIVDLPEHLEKYYFKCMLTSGGFSYERTYSGICERYTEKLYQEIGRYVENKIDFINPNKLY
jgi:predicted O-methyltransferase YrrM